jgi:tRNA(Ile)-lysidine synthase
LISPEIFEQVFERRLAVRSDAPLAVAFSGGGDSLALLLATRDWGRRRLLALTVDHGLSPASGDWTRACAETAARLGVDFRALAWTGEKPATGLPAAARAARHALLADAARQAGARVILMGHTASDLAESAAMRAEGSTVPDAREWGPSPAWPEGRGVFLLRPMLGLDRATIRDWLRARGETWIDDPANEDVRYARARARRRHSLPFMGREDAEGGGVGKSSQAPQFPTLAAGAAVPPHEGEGVFGAILLSRRSPPAVLAAACLCAAGTARPPRGDRLQRLAARLATDETFTATLAGARIEAGPSQALVARDAGALTGRQALPPGEAIVWDGRFALTATRPGLTVQALAGHAARLPPAQRIALARLPAAVRPGLPAVLDQSGAVSCPILARDGAVGCEVLALARFDAATGLVQSEPAL